MHIAHGADTADQKAIVARVLEEQDLDERRYPPRAVLAHIHKHKQEGRGPDEAASRSYVDDAAIAIFRAYEQRLRAANAVDFEDIILLVAKILETTDEGDRIRRRYDYVLVDEFQDTNRVQYQFLEDLVRDHHNLCVVGDDDQSIYRWRGADVRNIRGFRKGLPRGHGGQARAELPVEQAHRGRARASQARRDRGSGVPCMEGAAPGLRITLAMNLRRLLALSALASLTLAALLPGCSGKSSQGATPAGIYCSATVGPSTVCFGYSNLTSEQQSAVTQACTGSLGGTIDSSCPAGQVGCCTITAGYTTTECYYAGDAATLKAGCSGTWSTTGNGSSSGSGSSGSGSGGTASSSSGGSSGSSGSGSGGSGTCASNQVVCPKGCADIETDLNNCGSCGYVCATGPQGSTTTCQGGVCAAPCPSAEPTICGGDSSQGYCANTASDMTNCGTCGNTCQAPPSGGTEACTNGKCAFTCPAGETNCNGACVTLTSDTHCGSCNNSCSAGSACTNGVCKPLVTCPTGEVYCVTQAYCTNLQTDEYDCGACGVQCASPDVCSDGKCGCPVACSDGEATPDYCCPSGYICNGGACE